MKAIITKYLCATNNRGSRIKASCGAGGVSVVVPYDHELNGQDNHGAAAVALCRKYGWAGELVSGGLESGDMCFTFTDSKRYPIQ